MIVVHVHNATDDNLSIFMISNLIKSLLLWQCASCAAELVCSYVRLSKTPQIQAHSLRTSNTRC